MAEDPSYPGTFDYYARTEEERQIIFEAVKVLGYEIDDSFLITFTKKTAFFVCFYPRDKRVGAYSSGGTYGKSHITPPTVEQIISDIVAHALLMNRS